MARTDRESPEPSPELLSDASIVETLESVQSRLLTISSVADLLSSVSPTSTLNAQTLPALGSFLLEECGKVVSSLESLHKVLASLVREQDL